MTKHHFMRAALCALTLLPALVEVHAADAQNTPPPLPAQAPAEGGHQAGGFVPGQKRPPGDPAQIARGKTLYGISCRGCHGADLRGGDLGGPNLLRSQLALSDRDGESIVPIIQGARKAQGMPAIGLSIPDSKAVAAYVRSMVEMIQGQGAPPELGKSAPSILIGNAGEGKAYFNAKCAGCHSATGDLANIAGKYKDPKKLQNTWVAGGVSQEDESPQIAHLATVTVTLPSGQTLTGKLVQIDDFLVSFRQADGTERSIPRNGDVPTVVLNDPLKGHRDLLSQYSNKDVHDITAYLVTLK